MSQVNIAIVGIGNCASSLVQGLQFYGKGAEQRGLTNPTCAGYSVADVRVSAAFDVDVTKVGLDVSEAIWVTPNNSLAFARVPNCGVPVVEGILGDGVGPRYAERVSARGNADVEQVAEHLRQTHTGVVVNFLPVGSQLASERYAEAALLAGCGFVNCIPSVIARSSIWAERFREAHLPLMGDDLKSQFGATLVHHALIESLVSNGVVLKSTYQVVSGGNMDFVNLQDPERVKGKGSSKVSGMFGARHQLSAESVFFGAEYMPFLLDRKIAFIRVDGEGFGRTPVHVEVRMEVEDSPSAAGNVLAAVRYAKAAMERRLEGVMEPAAALLMKAPARPLPIPEALARLHALLSA